MTLFVVTEIIVFFFTLLAKRTTCSCQDILLYVTTKRPIYFLSESDRQYSWSTLLLYLSTRVGNAWDLSANTFVIAYARFMIYGIQKLIFFNPETHI